MCCASLCGIECRYTFHQYDVHVFHLWESLPVTVFNIGGFSTVSFVNKNLENNINSPGLLTSSELYSKEVRSAEGGMLLGSVEFVCTSFMTSSACNFSEIAYYEVLNFCVALIFSNFVVNKLPV